MNRRTATVYVDMLFLLVLVLVLLPHKPDDSQNDRKVGRMGVEIQWPEGSTADIDLWVRTPGDIPVGYARLRGRFASLLRDDIGTNRSPWRHEIIAMRDIPDGEYVVNLHYYSNRGYEYGKAPPVPVGVFVWYKNSSGSMQTIWLGEVTLFRTGQESTVVRFAMTDEALHPGSIHHTQENLRSPNG